MQILVRCVHLLTITKPVKIRVFAHNDNHIIPSLIPTVMRVSFTENNMSNGYTGLFIKRDDVSSRFETNKKTPPRRVIANPALVGRVAVTHDSLMPVFPSRP